MAVCKLTILSFVDGQENKRIRMGKLEREGEKHILFYREESAQVRICLQGGKATVDRVGDYSLFLPLEEGKVTLGRLGMGGSEGEIPVATSVIDYKAEENFLKVVLGYRLQFGAEPQKMRLEITAQTRGNL